MSTQSGIVDEILQERKRQGLKWRNQSGHSDPYWLAILTKEVGELAKTIVEGTVDRRKLVQAAAVCLAWLEAMDRRRGVKST